MSDISKVFKGKKGDARAKMHFVMLVQVRVGPRSSINPGVKLGAKRTRYPIEARCLIKPILMHQHVSENEEWSQTP